jgi:hypothetical protein
MHIQKMAEILLELRSESIQVNKNPSDDTIKKLMDKYSILFVGKDINCIYSNQLANCIKNVFSIPIENDELNMLIPTVCNTLNMKYEPMAEVTNTTIINPPIFCYQITLWQ